MYLKFYTKGSKVFAKKLVSENEVVPVLICTCFDDFYGDKSDTAKNRAVMIANALNKEA
jgi:hypothetical protein